MTTRCFRPDWRHEWVHLMAGTNQEQLMCIRCGKFKVWVAGWARHGGAEGGVGRPTPWAPDLRDPSPPGSRRSRE